MIKKLKKKAPISRQIVTPTNTVTADSGAWAAAQRRPRKG